MKQFSIQTLFIGCLVAGLIVGYLFAQMRPSHDRTQGKASVLVLSCIDPRYTNDLAWYLTHSQELHADYDLFCLAGASLGVLQNTHPGWQTTFFDHLDLAIGLHGVSEVWVFDHLDCGMYKATLKLDTDEDPKVHIHQMSELRKLLKAKKPELKFRGFMIDITGGVSSVL